MQGAGVLELENGATLTANVVNSGTLRLGGSQVADGTIAGNYTQTGTGTLDIKLGGAGAGQSDQLQVTGDVSLAGTLNVVLVDNFVPAQGDSFPDHHLHGNPHRRLRYQELPDAGQWKSIPDQLLAAGATRSW